ncbi:hypothetical protein KKC06_00020 [Patescibacteria group bacterium]|nr:hypothetical protein [Patescibacteria group bacterium]
MLLFNRFLPALSAIFIIITFELWSVQPQLIFYIAGTLGVIVVLTVWSLSWSSVISKKFWSILATPLFFVSSSYLFFMFIDNVAVSQIFILLIALVYFLILRNIFSFLYQTKNYQPYALENIYSYVNMGSLFMFYASFYGMFLYLSWDIWKSSILVFIFSTFLFTRTLWSFKIEWRKSKVFILIMGVLMIEIFYAISFLPTSFLFNALICILVYYLLMNIFKDFLRDMITGNNLKRYFLITITIAVIGFITTQWS